MRTRFVFAALICLLAVTAFAQPQRTFVSVNGDDASPFCSRSQPCRNFQAAVNAVGTGGEVVALDSGGFGPFSVARSVSVISPTGVYAAVTALSGPGISAGGSNVTLRGLYVNGLGGTHGITFGGGNLHVENVVVSGFPGGSGLLAGGGGRFTVRDSQFRQNQDGVFSAGTEGSIDHTRFDSNSQNGVSVGSNTKVTVRDSVMFSNAAGLSVSPFGTATLENCTISDGASGVAVADQASLRLSATSILNTTNALVRTGTPQVVSFGNNRFDGNGSDGTIDLTVPLK